MPNEYSLQELAKVSDVTPRTIRFYIEQGLLAAPTALGSKARYTDDHLDRLRIIKKLQAAHLPLAEIRTRLRGFVAGEPLLEPAQVGETALDYINQLLRPTPTAPPAASMPAPAVAYRQLSIPAASEPPEPAKPAEPERAQWERIALDPDIEIHIRRPLTRQQNKRVERLISIARQLLEE